MAESAVTGEHAAEVAQGRRFEFGANWTRFLSALDDGRIAEAESSLRAMLGLTPGASLAGKSFLDIGSGSGLFSLAARRLGAVVRSFDYDPKSVACTRELQRRYFPGDPGWVVEEGSILDERYVATLGTFDVVYSWGVLHHTGEMWRALEQAQHMVNPGGLLWVAIYNKQAGLSTYWLWVKRLYNALPAVLKRPFAGVYLIYFAVLLFVADVVRARPPLRRYRGQGHRGMSLYHDVVDWVGGLPFEVASPKELIGFYEECGFSVVKLKTCGTKHGCNEVVVRKG